MIQVFAKLLFLLALFFVGTVYAQGGDPNDPFDLDQINAASEEDLRVDEQKTPDVLMREAEALWDDERYVDARTKLLAALKKAPNDYRIHIMLARYYLANVGHFRLALQYVKQAQKLFAEKFGAPPYASYTTQSQHMVLLYLLSQCRLNLDNYQGALDVLDEFTKLGYYNDWYAGSRAWILMKLGRVQEAIRVAQLGAGGILGGGEKGQVLNMLGILYSMSGDRKTSIEIFRRAVAYELSQGKTGQPATPLNNVGEVYKELFDDDKAETSWLRATSLPDGCEHVLPALNLALLYLDQLNLEGAKKAIDNFEGCVAQFPLRNGEEHRALVHLIRGRTDLLAGRVDAAIAHFESALVRKQWFGKIGTSGEDLQAAVTMSLAQALDRKAARQAFFEDLDNRGLIERASESLDLSLRSWWYMRRARQILTETLNSFEDISIRNTDSLLEYPTLGELTRGLPLQVLERRVNEELRVDKREGAAPYYNVYLAERYLEAGQVKRAQAILGQMLNLIRPRYDNFLRLHVYLLQLASLDSQSEDYTSIANLVFSLNRPSLPNYGFRLPVNYVVSDKRLFDLLASSPFILDNKQGRQYLIRSEVNDGEYVLEFSAQTGVLGNIRVKSRNPVEAVRKFVDEIFVIELGGA